MFELAFGLSISLALLALGYFAGGATERRHFKRLAEREAGVSAMLVSQTRDYPGGVDPQVAPRALMAEAVISTDYLKNFVAGIKKFFGGELHSYESLLERARREALLRVVEEAASQGCDAVCNVRFTPIDIGKAVFPQKQVVAVAMMACGTAYRTNRVPA